MLSDKKKTIKDLNLNCALDYYFICIQVPGILAALQKSVQAVLLGRSYLPDWFNYGVRSQSLSQVFKLDNAKGRPKFHCKSILIDVSNILLVLNCRRNPFCCV